MRCTNCFPTLLRVSHLCVLFTKRRRRNNKQCFSPCRDKPPFACKLLWFRRECGMEKGAGISPPLFLRSSSHGRREHCADAAHRTHVPHFVTKCESLKKTKTKKNTSKQKKEEKASPTRDDHRCGTGAVSPSEHEHKSAAFSGERAACGEDGLTESLCCRRRGA